MKDRIKIQILIKLTRRDYWGHRMINLSDLIKIVPRHLRGEAKKIIGELYKEHLLNRKPGIKAEFRYSLSMEKKWIIDKIIMYKDDTFKV